MSGGVRRLEICKICTRALVGSVRCLGESEVGGCAKAEGVQSRRAGNAGDRRTPETAPMRVVRNLCGSANAEGVHTRRECHGGGTAITQCLLMRRVCTVGDLSLHDICEHSRYLQLYKPLLTL